jgi:hypothetical protein
VGHPRRGPRPPLFFGGVGRDAQRRLDRVARRGAAEGKFGPGQQLVIELDSGAADGA